MSIFHRDIQGAHGAAIILSLMGVFSQILAVLRDKIFAFKFGGGEVLDLYYAAFRIPDLVFIVLGSIVSVSVLVPLLSSKKEDKVTIDEIWSFFGISALVISVIAFFLMPFLVKLFFASATVDFQHQISTLSRIMLLSPLLLGLSSIFASILQVKRIFVLYSLSPLLYNLGIIIGGLLFYSGFGTKGLIMGVVCGALMHMAVPLPYLFKNELIPRRTTFNFRKMLRKVVSPSLPRTISISLSQILFTFALSIAAVKEGDVTKLSFANNIYNVPISLIGVSYSLSVFSILSNLWNEEKISEYKRTVEQTARWMLFLSIPVSIFIIVFSEQIVRILIGGGNFSLGAQESVGSVLTLLALSVPFACISLLLSRSWYAVGSTKEPFFAQLIGFSVGLISLLSFKGLSGISLALSLSSIVSGVLLIFLYWKKFGFAPFAALHYLSRLLIIWVIIGMVAFWLHFMLIVFTGISTPWFDVIWAVVASICSLIVGYFFFKNTDIPEIKQLKRLLYQAKSRIVSR